MICDTFLLVFCSLSLEGTKGAEVTQLDYQHLWDLEKTACIACIAVLYFSYFFKAGQCGLYLET